MLLRSIANALHFSRCNIDQGLLGIFGQWKRKVRFRFWPKKRGRQFHTIFPLRTIFKSRFLFSLHAITQMKTTSYYRSEMIAVSYRETIQSSHGSCGDTPTLSTRGNDLAFHMPLTGGRLIEEPSHQILKDKDWESEKHVFCKQSEDTRSVRLRSIRSDLVHVKKSINAGLKWNFAPRRMGPFQKSCPKKLPCTCRNYEYNISDALKKSPPLISHATHEFQQMRLSQLTTKSRVHELLTQYSHAKYFLVN